MGSNKLINENEIQALIEQFKTAPQIIAEQAMYDLTCIGIEAVPILLNCLKIPNSNIRYYSTYTLIYIGDERAVNPILEMLFATEDELAIVEELAASLGEKFPNLDIDLLLNLATSENWKQRFIAAIILRYSNEKRVFEGLLKLLSDPIADVRYVAASSLGRIKDNRAYEPLLVALEDNDSRMRQNAIIGLGRIGDKKAIPYLNKVLQNDQDQFNRKIAREAIIVLSDKDSPLRKSVRWWTEPGIPLL